MKVFSPCKWETSQPKLSQKEIDRLRATFNSSKTMSLPMTINGVSYVLNPYIRLTDRGYYIRILKWIISTMH